MNATDRLASAAESAISMALEMYRERAPLTVHRKGDRDLVTSLDNDIERRLRDFLRAQSPDIGILGEEFGRSGTSDSYWVLDPIDGTANLARGIPLHAISLALRIDGIVTLGIVAAPALGDLYWARNGRGSYKNGKQIAAADTMSMTEALVSMGDFAVGENASNKNRARLSLISSLATTAQRVRMIGTAALDLAWVAEGRLDASIVLSNKEWDTAAGSLLAREAGAVVIGEHGQPHDRSSRATIAVAPALLPDVKNLLSEIDS